MGNKKVSQLTEANSVNDSDLLMIVQGGVSKKVTAGHFVKAGDTVQNATTLGDGNYTPSDFLGANETAADSAKLGGVDANQYARKNEINVDINDYLWCMPKPWYFNIEQDSGLTTKQQELAEALRSVGYVVCDGRRLDTTLYKDLYEIIGHTFDLPTDSDSSKFRIPNMRGRFPLGANMTGTETWTEMVTKNLPDNTYAEQTGVFTAGGQFIFPAEVGMRGGDPTTTQERASQMASHLHKFHGEYIDAGNNIGTVNAEGSRYGYMDARSEAGNRYDETYKTGSNEPENAVYPPNEYSNPLNSGMLSMPPYITFCYIMKIYNGNAPTINI